MDINILVLYSSLVAVTAATIVATVLIFFSDAISPLGLNQTENHTSENTDHTSIDIGMTELLFVFIPVILISTYYHWLSARVEVITPPTSELHEPFLVSEGLSNRVKTYCAVLASAVLFSLISLISYGRKTMHMRNQLMDSGTTIDKPILEQPTRATKRIVKSPSPSLEATVQADEQSKQPDHSLLTSCQQPDHSLLTSCQQPGVVEQNLCQQPEQPGTFSLAYWTGSLAYWTGIDDLFEW